MVLAHSLESGKLMETLGIVLTIVMLTQNLILMILG